jgi:hypothetical protein
MLLTHASHPDPFEANSMPPTYDSMHQCSVVYSFASLGVPLREARVGSSKTIRTRFSRPDNRLSEAQQKVSAKILKLWEAHFRSRSLMAGISKLKTKADQKTTSQRKHNLIIETTTI